MSLEAARSEWVNREVEYGLAHKDSDRILPVLTDGSFVWDQTSGRLDPSSSVPPALLAGFSEEPRWVDLRWAREDTLLDLRNSRFRGAVADVASAVRGIPKDDVESEEVRQHHPHRLGSRCGFGGPDRGVGSGRLHRRRSTGRPITARGEAETQRNEAETP